MNLLDSFRDSDDIAFRTNEKQVSFRQLHRRSEELVSELEQKFTRGECIIVSSRNPVTYISMLFASQRLGLIFCCWNGKTDLASLGKLVLANGAIETLEGSSAIICSRLATESFQHIGNFIITTSGSSGTPKGVALDLDNVIENARAAGNAINFGAYRLVEWCIDTDFSLMSAVSHLFMAWHERLPLRHLNGTPDHTVVDLFRTQRRGFGGAPLQLTKLTQMIPEFHTGSLLVSSGDFLTQSNLFEIRKRHNAISVCTFYGLTELSGRFCFMTDHKLRTHPGAAGHPIEGSSYDLTQENEVRAYSDYLFAGYYQESGFEERSGSFTTGDIGKIDEAGYLWLIGRNSDTFKVSGLKVNRKIIEAKLDQLFADIEFCVLPVEHPSMGTCCAIFIAKQLAEKRITKAQIVNSIRPNLSREHIPVYYYDLLALPRLSNGKLNKQLLISNHASYPRYR
jgi:long-chain acyl-CoA synthetase